MEGIIYPKSCRESIYRITRKVGISPEIAYSMMLMTAALMDLHPEDDEVVQMIMHDCGIYED